MRTLVATLLVAVLALVGCGSDDGATGAEETGGGASSDDAGGATDQTTVPFTLTSPAFEDGDPIPDEYAYLGGNTSPPLAWSGVPTDAEELAITVVDPDASNFVHWVLTGIDPTTTEIDAGAVPSGAVEALNQFGEPGWGGPSPPPGRPHTYLFTLHALSASAEVTAETAGQDAVEAIEAVTVERAELRGEYETE